MTILYKPHEHDLPDPRGFPTGSVVTCDCTKVFVRAATTYGPAWRQLGNFGIGWRRLMGRI